MGQLKDFALINPKTAPLTAESPFITMSAVPAHGQWARPDTTKGAKGGTRAQGGDVLVARITPCLENGKIAKVPRDLGSVGGSTEFIVLRGTQLVNSDYLFLWASERTTHTAAISLMTGSTGRQRVSASDYAALPINLPPLAEQERIVDLIGCLDDTIEAVEEQVCSLRRLSSSSRSKIFATLLESYPRTTAGEFFEVTLGRQKSARQLHGNHEIPYLRAANIAAGALSISDVQTMNFDPKEQTKYSLRNGDVLVVEGGSVGQTAVWRNEIDGPVGFDKHVLRIRGRAEISAVAFANHWAQWCYESGRFEAEARGVTIKALGYQRAKNMTVPKASLAVQNETAEFLDAMDLAVHSSEETSASLRSLRSELLAALLSGSHTIPDSYDDLMAERVA